MGSSDKKKKFERILPKKGSVHLQAKKGKVLPVFYEGGIVRITPDKHLKFALDRAPYDTLIMFERALQAKDIEMIDMKKYLEEKSKKMDKPTVPKAVKSNEKTASHGGK